MPNIKHRIRPGGLSPRDHERISALANQGWKSTRIAKAIEKHPSTVQWFMYRNGLMAPKYPTHRVRMRQGRPIKLFTPEEDAFITALRVQGVGPTEIARQATRRFGHPRTRRTISYRLTALAALEDAA